MKKKLAKKAVESASSFIKKRFPREKKNISLGSPADRAKKAKVRADMLSSAPRTSEGKIIKQIPKPYPAKQAKKEQFLSNPSKKKFKRNLLPKQY